MKVLFYSIYANFMPPFGTLLELIKREQEAGNEIYIIKCEGVFTSCHANLKHHPLKCARCIERSDFAFDLMGVKKENIFAIKSFKEAESFEVPIFHSTEELLHFKYKGYEIGRGVASTIISRSRNLEVTSALYGPLIELYMKMAIHALESLSEVLEKIQPERTYVYNGRQPEDRPLILLSEKLGINFRTFVNGATIEKFRLFENGSVHYFHSMQQDIQDVLHRDGLTEEEIDKTGNAFFESVFNNRNADLKDFTKQQQAGLLPSSFDTNKINVAIYNSSEDEMKTFDGWKTPLYTHQTDALKKICAQFAQQPEVMFYLRIHPNLSRVKNQQMADIYALNYPNLEVIDAHSPVSTYALMDACDKTITFGSSTGPEATQRGKPSILVGKSFYDQLNCVYTIQSYDELEVLILDKNLAPKPAINARKYAYYIANHGQYHQYLEFKDKGHDMLGERIEAIRPKFFYQIVVTFFKQFKQWRKTKKLIASFGFD